MVASVDLEWPFRGRWLTQSSPANRVPSHGTTLFGTSYSIDFVPVDDSGRTARISWRSVVRPEAADQFPGFGRPLLAPVDGIVVAAHASEPDHAAYRGLPSVGYLLTQRRRAQAGWVALAGNHVLIDAGNFVVAVCHFQQGSVEVRPGESVQVGDLLGRCGNSGNSTEPHVHVQVIDSRDVQRASAVPMTFRGELPRNGEIVHPDGDSMS